MSETAQNFMLLMTILFIIIGIGFLFSGDPAGWLFSFGLALSFGMWLRPDAYREKLQRLLDIDFTVIGDDD